MTGSEPPPAATLSPVEEGGGRTVRSPFKSAFISSFLYKELALKSHIA